MIIGSQCLNQNSLPIPCHYSATRKSAILIIMIIKFLILEKCIYAESGKQPQLKHRGHKEKLHLTTNRSRERNRETKSFFMEFFKSELSFGELDCGTSFIK